MYDAIVLAAGSGSRSGLNYNKVFYKIDDKTVIEHSLSNFIADAQCHKIILVISEVDEEEFLSLNFNAKVKLTYGGSERIDSVINGLRLVDSEYVLIHDGARPFLKNEDLIKLKASLNDYDAALLMVKSIDTSKVVINGEIKSTLKRNEIYNAQTPQAFKTSILKNAYLQLNEADKKVITDDAQIIELYCQTPIKMIEGSYSNIKITTKNDLER